MVRREDVHAERADVADVMLELRTRTARLLPEGRLLPEQVWLRRHRAIVRLCLASAALLVLFAWLRGYGQPAAVGILLVVAALVSARLPPFLPLGLGLDTSMIPWGSGRWLAQHHPRA